LKRLRLVGDKHKTLDHFPSTVSIVGTPTGVHIQQSTRNVRVENLIGILILNLVQTTQCAAVTKRLPLFACHLASPVISASDLRFQKGSVIVPYFATPWIEYPHESSSP
jgi:hypothetical protein